MRRIVLVLGVAFLLAAQPAASLGADDSLTITIWPVVTSLPDGGIVTTYAFPDGEVMTVPTPPPGFDPLTATDAQLTEYGFPLPPSEASDHAEWAAAMAAFTSDDPPTGPLQVELGSPPPGATYTTKYTIWGGYIAGATSTQSDTYVAVKGVFHVPTNTGTCASSNRVAFWIGLGGTGGDYPYDDLVQQGIECGNTDLYSGSSYHPWTEFAQTAYPAIFCGVSWTLSATHTIYQNMSFQTSQNEAFFYLEDETSGVAHSCHHTPPSGWHWDLNTAEWIGEDGGSSNTVVDFGSVRFTDAHTELNSNGNWVTLGSQLVTKVVDGSNIPGHFTECIVPGSISSGTAFTDSWIDGSCGYAPPS